MDRKKSILYLTEGKRPDQAVLQQFIQTFGLDEGIIVLSGHNIYKLYEKTRESPYLDTVGLIQESLQTRNDLSEEEQGFLSYDVSDIDQIFLFFDLDCHIWAAEPHKVETLLETFADEFEEGKLFIHYPMVESFRQLAPETYDTGEGHQLLKAFKNWSYSQSGNKQTSSYIKTDYSAITRLHLKRANQLVNQSSDLPSTLIPQPEIHTQICEQYLPKNQVLLLSGFPFFLHHYYGNMLEDRLD